MANHFTEHAELLMTNNLDVYAHDQPNLTVTTWHS